MVTVPNRFIAQKAFLSGKMQDKNLLDLEVNAIRIAEKQARDFAFEIEREHLAGVVTSWEYEIIHKYFVKTTVYAFEK